MPISTVPVAPKTRVRRIARSSASLRGTRALVTDAIARSKNSTTGGGLTPVGL